MESLILTVASVKGYDHYRGSMKEVSANTEIVTTRNREDDRSARGATQPSCVDASGQLIFALSRREIPSQEGQRLWPGQPSHC